MRLTRLRRPEPAQDELQRRRARVRQHAHRALPRRHRRRRRARLGGARVRKRAPVLRRHHRRRRCELAAADETAVGVRRDGSRRAGAAVRRELPQDPRPLPHLRDELLAQPRDQMREPRERRSRSRRRVHGEIGSNLERGEALAPALLRQRELRRRQRGANGAVRALDPRRGRRGGYRWQPARRAVALIEGSASSSQGSAAHLAPVRSRRRMRADWSSKFPSRAFAREAAGNLRVRRRRRRRSLGGRGGDEGVVLAVTRDEPRGEGVERRDKLVDDLRSRGVVALLGRPSISGEPRDERDGRLQLGEVRQVRVADPVGQDPGNHRPVRFQKRHPGRVHLRVVGEGVDQRPRQPKHGDEHRVVPSAGQGKGRDGRIRVADDRVPSEASREGLIHPRERLGGVGVGVFIRKVKASGKCVEFAKRGSRKVSASLCARVGGDGGGVARAVRNVRVDGAAVRQRRHRARGVKGAGPAAGELRESQEERHVGPKRRDLLRGAWRREDQVGKRRALETREARADDAAARQRLAQRPHDGVKLARSGVRV
mmetsp:Transcript_9482/g.38450  ORF Transcript_9482/g.38450 Transcript_9482/m.38450 type:complete len:542 (+) Transcript_9482:662-2287(+)